MSILHSRNSLLTRLSDEDIFLLGTIVKVDLRLNQSLEIADSPVEFVYFIEAGVASVVENVLGKRSAEIGVIGYEGMTGLALVLGDTQPSFNTSMQCEGTALRIEASRLRSGMDASESLRVCMLLYARTFMVQLATTAYANCRSSLGERLARWLLMIGDRMGETFQITHELLSIILAVRRAGVTEALKALERMGMILNTRGTIRILSRPMLIDASQGSYGRAESEYLRLLP